MGEAKNSPEERRENFRVKDTALLEYRPLSAAEAEAWRERGGSPVPDAFDLASWFGELRQKTTLLHRQTHLENPKLADYVATLDQKLDRLMQVMLIRDMNLPQHAPQEVDIGAEGLGFVAGEPLQAGRILELHLLLLSTGTGLRMLGEVVRCEPVSGGYEVGVSLEYQREADRELLLHHLLHRQSELIRERNLAEVPERSG